MTTHVTRTTAQLRRHGCRSFVREALPRALSAATDGRRSGKASRRW